MTAIINNEVFDLDIYKLFYTRNIGFIKYMLKTRCYNDIDYNKLFIAACFSTEIDNIKFALELGANVNAIPYSKYFQEIGIYMGDYTYYYDIYCPSFDESILWDHIMWRISKSNVKIAIEIAKLLYDNNFKFDEHGLIYMNVLDNSYDYTEYIKFILSHSDISQEIFTMLFKKYNSIANKTYIEVLMQYGCPDANTIKDVITTLTSSKYDNLSIIKLICYYDELFDLSIARDELALIFDAFGRNFGYDEFVDLFKIMIKHNIDIEKHIVKVMISTLYCDTKKITQWIKGYYGMAKIMELLHQHIIDI
jgi:hypothetical protein